MVETTTLIVLLAVALVVMSVVVGALVVRLIHKNNELKEKNDVIVREVRRNQTLIDRAVQQGVSRAAMLSFSLLLLVGSVSVLTSCTKDDDTIYVPDPTDASSTSPLVTVVYSPDALGDRSYNDQIYASVEDAASQHELRTLHLSPATKAEGLAYLEDIFRQLETPGDTIPQLLIVASSDYDAWLRQNNKRLEGNPRADLLYFETSTPLGGTGAPAIGNYGINSCGTITIGNTVSRVTATKGSGATNSIGFAGSDFGSCGQVTIGGTVYWDGSAYQNGGETYLATSPLTYQP